MSSQITVKDVARVAKVSVGTVSRVLRGEPNVKPETETRVREAAERLNYTRLRKPKRSAKADDEIKDISLLMLGMDRTLSNLPCVADAIHGAECALAQSGARVTIADLPHVDRVPESLRGRGRRVHGILAKGALQGGLVEQCDDRLKQRMKDLPTVWLLGRPQNADWGDVVESNDAEVGRLAAEYLISRGHRSLAVLNPKPDQVLFGKRSASFQWHAVQAGASVDRFLGKPSEWTLPLQTVHDVAAVDELFERLWATKQRPTAIFVPADSIAALVYRACARRGLRIGKDISLISCNRELPLMAGLYPQLTTVDVCASAIGRQAAQQLLWRIQNTSEVNLSVSVEPRLVEGESVAAL